MNFSTSSSVTNFLLSYHSDINSLRISIHQAFTSLVSNSPFAYLSPIVLNSSSSSRKNSRNWYGTSTDRLAPNFLCSSILSLPPEKHFPIFFWTYFLVSVMKIVVSTTLALIFPDFPFKEGKNFEWIQAGLLYLSFHATSQVILK